MYLGLAHRLTRTQSETPAFALDLLQPNLDSRVTFSRASSATDVVNGTLVNYASDVARISSANGLLIEGSRTNSLRNANAGGATAGVIGSGGVLPTNWQVASTGGLTTQVISSGALNGFSVLRLRISGTPSGTSYLLMFDTATQVSAALNDVWTASLWTALSSGSLTNIAEVAVRAEERDAAGALLAFSKIALTPAASLAKRDVTRTMASASTGRVSAALGLTLTVGQVVDLTLDIAAPQLELGAFASSYIPTSSGAATRAADLATAPISWVNMTEGTLWAEAVTGGIDPAASTSPRVVALSSSDNSSGHYIRRSVTNNIAQGTTVVSGVTQSSMGSVVWGNGLMARIALAWRNNDEAFCFSGTAVQTDVGTPNGMPSSLTVFRIGTNSTTSGFFFGYVRGVRGWTRRLSDSQIKAVTS